MLSESRFCLFSLNFALLVFYLSEKVVVNVPDLISFESDLNEQHESQFQQSVIAIFISLFLYLLPTSPFLSRIQFKSLRLVCVISPFYKPLLKTKTQKPLYSRRELNCDKLYKNNNNINHVVMFCFGLQSIGCFINSNVSDFNTHRLEAEAKFS